MAFFNVFRKWVRIYWSKNRIYWFKSQFEPVWYWRQNFQSEFSDHFSKFQIFNILITLKIKKWQHSSDQRANVHVFIKNILDKNNSEDETMRNLKFPLTYIIMHKAEFKLWTHWVSSGSGKVLLECIVTLQNQAQTHSQASTQAS